MRWGDAQPVTPARLGAPKCSLIRARWVAVGLVIPAMGMLCAGGASGARRDSVALAMETGLCPANECVLGADRGQAIC